MNFSVANYNAEIVPERPSQVVDWGVLTLKAQGVWGKTQGENVKIAILDTGADITHPDLVQNIKGYMNLTGGEITDVRDTVGHGTHVAGIIGAANNQIGVVGIAPNAELHIVKVLGEDGEGSINSIIQGIAYAIENRVDIISMSLGCTQDPGSMLHQAIKFASDQGIIIVAAAGNEAGAINWPAVYDEVISVGAIDSKLHAADFSNHGKVDIVAPGVDILSTYPVNRYARLSGTSMATPMVTGLLALYLSHCKKNNIPYSKESIVELFQIDSQDLGNKGKDEYYGYGLFDITKAIK